MRTASCQRAGVLNHLELNAEKAPHEDTKTACLLLLEIEESDVACGTEILIYKVGHRPELRLHLVGSEEQFSTDIADRQRTYGYDCERKEDKNKLILFERNVDQGAHRRQKNEGLHHEIV